MPHRYWWGWPVIAAVCLGVGAAVAALWLSHDPHLALACAAAAVSAVAAVATSMAD